MDHVTRCDHLADELITLEAAIRAADPQAPVPTCPGWSVRKLTAHVGAVHRWAEATVASSSPTRLDMRSIDLELPARDGGAESWADWIAGGGAKLLATLRACDPTAAAWSWAEEQTAGWWLRRQLHETVIHRIDAQHVAGPVSPVDPLVAVDGIDEHLSNIKASATFSPEVAVLRGEGSLHLHATDVEGEWMIELGPDGFEISHGHGKGTVAARGRAEDLLAAVYQRGPVDRLEVFGDAELLDWWIINSALQ